MPHISILMAAYNVEKYIRQAMDSAVSQTLSDIEIICVDDCSTDSTPAILAEYAARDARVRIIRHGENKGLFETRRTGVAAATGEYALFLDGDDYLAADTCRFLYKAVTARPVDMLHFGIEAFKNDGSDIPPEQMAGYEAFCRPWDKPLPQKKYAVLNACFVQRQFSYNLCSKLLATDLLQQVYRECGGLRLNMAEDMLVTFLIASRIESYAGIPNKLYHYRIGSGMSTTAQKMPLTPQQIAAFAQEYQVYTFLESRFGQNTNRDVQAALQKVRRTIVDDILNAFFNRTHAGDLQVFLTKLFVHFSAQEFLYEAASYCDRPDGPHISQITAKLRGMPVPMPQRVKTIGSFYYRLYNGGIERVMVLLARIWLQAGYRVVLITEQQPNRDDYPVPEGVERVVLPATDSLAQRTRAWQQLVETYRIDSLVYHAWLGPNLAVDSMAVKSMGASFIVHSHGPAYCVFAQGSTITANRAPDYALADAIVNLTDTDAAWWSAMGFRSIRTTNPLTFTPATVQPSPLQGHTVLWVGRLSWEKQLDQALGIARLVRQEIPAFHMQVVGGADNAALWAQYRQLVEDFDVGEYVTLEGYHTDVAPFYQNASAILSTSCLEGSSMAHLEAQAFGMPLVSYELPNSDVLRSGLGVFVVQQGDQYNAAQYLIQLLKNRDIRQAAGQAARRSAMDIASLDLARHWNSIFDAAAQVTPPFAPLICRPPLEAAIGMVLEETEKNARTKDSETIDRLRQQIAQYAITVDSLTNSTIFKVGRIVTWPVRKLKKLLRRG